MAGMGIGKAGGEAFVGGHVNNVVNLSKELLKNGHKVHLVTTPPIYSDFGDLGFTGIPVTCIKIRGDYSNVNARYGLEFIAKATLAIRSLHKRERFDVVHIHSGTPALALLSINVNILCGLSSVHTLYCPLPRNLISRIFAKCCLMKTNSINVLSENTKMSLIGIVPEHKISVVPPLIDISLFESNLRQPLSRDDLEGGNGTILFFGNLKETKGLDILIKALKIVKQDVPNVKLLMGLDMPLKIFRDQDNGIKDQIRALGLQENVVPLGIIKDRREVLAEADVYVAPFRSTQGPADHPLAILEAMASGLPIVATNVEGIPEIVQHEKTGLLVEPSNALQLAESIIHLLRNRQEGRELGKSGSHFVRDLSKDVVTRVVSIYEELIGN
ncbi:glycosyltransferase family 4 protein [Chloroflexota bacterium]